MIESNKIELYKYARLSGFTQKIASNISGFSERTAGRIEHQGIFSASRKIGRPSTLSSYIPAIQEWFIDSQKEFKNPPKSVEILSRLRALGYEGGKSAVYDLVRHLRPETNNIKHLNKEEVLIQWMHQLLQGRIKRDELLLKYSNILSQEEVLILLDCILNRQSRYRNRAVAIFSHLNNIPNKLISDFLLIKQPTISFYIKSYKSGGINRLIDIYNFKKLKKSEDPKYTEKVFEILHCPPSTYGINRTSWKIDDIHKIILEADFKISKDNIRKIIRNAGYKIRSAKRVLTSTDPNYKEKLQKITKILSNLGPNEKFFSIDEYGPFSVKTQGGRMLMPPGEINIVPQYQKSKGTLIITAAIELSTNQVIHFYSDKKNTKEMIKLLDILLEKYSDEECIYLSWDAASWHASQALYERVEEVNSTEYKNKHKSPIVKLAPLPACAQFLNIIESIFSGMSRAIIHNSNYESVDASKIAIDLYFQERNQHFKKNPKRAGNKIWGKERVIAEFNESNNCKDPRYR